MSIHQGVESIVLGSVTTLAKERWYALMQVKNEITYQITMNYLKQMLEKKIITLDEYNKMNEELQKKYEPKISQLFLEKRQ